MNSPVRHSKKSLLIVFFLIAMTEISAMAQYAYRWDIGGTMGMGVTLYSGGDDPIMSATIGFERAIDNTKWRWGIEAGLMNQGIVDYAFEEGEPERLVRYDFAHIGAYANYHLFSFQSLGEDMTVYAKAGLAPALQSNRYVYHTDNKQTVLGIVGVGMDYIFSKLLLTCNIAPDGIFVINISYGWWFGKRNNR